jgi:hypothetical protein
MSYHQKGCNYPVDEYAEKDLLPDVALREDLVEALVSDFAEDGIHHDEQADGCQIKSVYLYHRISCLDTYWNRDANEFALLKSRSSRRDKVAQDNTDYHGEEDPYC